MKKQNNFPPAVESEEIFLQNDKELSYKYQEENDTNPFTSFVDVVPHNYMIITNHMSIAASTYTNTIPCQNLQVFLSLTN